MKLALGTVQFGLAYGIANQSGQVNREEAGRILAAAAAAGIDTLDTAIAYGDSERTLGQIGVSGRRIVSKLPALPDECTDVAGWVESEVAGSLARLGVGKLHAVLLHRPEQLFEARGEQLMAALESLKSKGCTSKIGVSIYAPDELDRLFANWGLDLVQAPLNILDRSLVDSGWAKRLKSQGVEIHVRSVFLQGLLLMPTGQLPEKFNRWLPLWVEWRRWLEETGLSPLEACMRYVLSIAEVDRIVVGVDGVAQLEEILGVKGDPLPGMPRWPQTIDRNLINPACWNQL